MKNIFFFLLFFGVVIISAQTSNIQITSENQEPFNLFINGQQVSNMANNVHDVSGMNQGVNYEIVVDYVMPNTADIKTSLNIMRNNESGILLYLVPKFNQGSLIYKGVKKENGQISMDANISIDLNMNENGFNVSMGMDENSNTNISSSSSTSTNSGTVSQAHSNAYNSSQASSNAYNPPPSNQNMQQTNQPNVVYVQGYNGRIGCSNPVNKERFDSMMESVEDASFAEDKVRVAKRILKTNCLTIDNLVMILEEISFDEDQLELAKFAYDHVYDLENYYKVYDVFSFSKSGEELEEYIENR